MSTIEGTVNEGSGKLTGNRKQEVKGKVQKAKGKLQDGLGQAEDVLDKADDGLGGVQDRGRRQPLLVAIAGALIVLVVAGLLTGLLRMSRD